MLAVAVTVSLVYTVDGDSEMLSTEGAVLEMLTESPAELVVEPSSTVTVQVTVSPLLVDADRLLDDPTVTPLMSQL